MRPSSEAILLVEGPDDKWSIIGLVSQDMAARGERWDQTPWRPDVQDRGGVREVLDSLGVSLKSTPRLGIVVDADENRDARWAALRDRLRRDGVAAPELPTAEGWVGQGLLPGARVGVWLMPDNQMPGTLEDFLGAMVPEADPCWELARQGVSEASARYRVERNEAWRSKARIHTWLSWQDRPGQPLGQAITARALGRQGSEARAFLDWFQRVFSP